MFQLFLLTLKYKNGYSFLKNRVFNSVFIIKNIGFGPSNLIIGERVLLSNEYSKKHNNLNLNNNNLLNQNLRGNTLTTTKQEDDGISKLIKKYNPQYEQSLKVMNEAFNKLGDNKTSKLNNMNNSNMLRGKTPTNKLKDNKTTIQNNEKNNFLNSFLKGNESNNSTIGILEYTKEKNNFSVSQAINSFNANKIKQPQNNKLKSKGILIKSGNGPKVQLNLLEITNKNQNQNCFNFNYTKPNDNNSDNIKINFGIIRLNLFPEYVSTCLSIVSEYQNYMKQPQMKNPIKAASGLKLQRQLYTMKTYIYQYLNKLPSDKQNEQIKKYIEYLKR